MKILAFAAFWNMLMMTTALAFLLIAASLPVQAAGRVCLCIANTTQVASAAAAASTTTCSASDQNPDDMEDGSSAQDSSFRIRITSFYTRTQLWHANITLYSRIEAHGAIIIDIFGAGEHVTSLAFIDEPRTFSFTLHPPSRPTYYVLVVTSNSTAREDGFAAVEVLLFNQTAPDAPGVDDDILLQECIAQQQAIQPQTEGTQNSRNATRNTTTARPMTLLGSSATTASTSQASTNAAVSAPAGSVVYETTTNALVRYAPWIVGVVAMLGIVLYLREQRARKQQQVHDENQAQSPSEGPVEQAIDL